MIKFPLVPGKMKKYLIPTTVVLLLSACSSYNEDNPLVPVESERSVLIYMAAENNLSSFADTNLADIKASFMETFDTENAGVVSMFFPQKSYSSTTPNWNNTIQQYQWNSLIQWSQYGW